jgi:phage/plasmid-like protein (TIGR03299 family)
MSHESYDWLSTNVLAGFAEVRPPWWSKGGEPNLYPGPVPVQRVKELLCSWQPLAESLYTADMQLVPSHKLIVASDDKSHLGVVGADAATHTYGDWLVGTVEECVRPDELEVSSAGLLRNRAQAWIQIERPETAVGPDGIKFSPYVTLSTSLDGSLSSQINQNTQMTICDNTLSVTRGQGVAFKHTSRSQSKLGTYRGVMTAIMQGESDFKEVLEKLLASDVSEQAFSRFLASFVPINPDDAPAKKTRSERKRQEITQLYWGDDRVQQWRGTKFGVVQAVNTWQQHMSQLTNRTGYEMDDRNLRAMRNYGSRLRGAQGDDLATLKVLESVLV